MLTERILFCADNVLDAEQYPGHSLVPDEAATGYEEWHVADGRRDAAHAWRATTANADHTLTCTFDQPRGIDFAAIDRESNHVDSSSSPPVGRRFQLLESADGFTTSRAIWDVTMPPIVGGSMAGGIGALTDEGAWLKTHTLATAHAVRLVSKAMGAGVVPQLTLVHIGKAWQPSQAQVFYPNQAESLTVTMQQSETPYGWVGRNRPARKRAGAIVIKPPDESDYDFIRWQVLGLYAAGFPAWLVHDRIDGSRRAMLVRCPQGQLDWARQSDWPLRGLAIPFEEEQAA